MEVTSENSGVILPRLNNEAAVATAQTGMVMYDKADRALKYYDGIQWISLQSNTGQVKINNYAPLAMGTPGPRGSRGAGQRKYIKFETDGFTSPTGPGDVVTEGELQLSPFPTTTWPANVGSQNPPQSAVYNFDEDTFIENAIEGQAHIWRIELSYTGKPTSGDSGLQLRIENPNSDFVQDQIQTLPRSASSGAVVFNVLTIADKSSLPSSGEGGFGYRFSVISEDTISAFFIESVTRFSLQK
jgi:hypothetical protein